MAAAIILIAEFACHENNSGLFAPFSQRAMCHGFCGMNIKAEGRTTLTQELFSIE